MALSKSILFLCAGYGGGISKMLRFVMSICVGQFSQVSLLHRGRESDNDTIPDCVNEIVIPFDKSKLVLIRRYRQICDIRKEILRIKPNVVCCFGSEMSVMLAFALIGIRGIAIIQAERGDPYTNPLIWKILSKWAFSRADYCVFQLDKQGQWYGKNVMSRSVVIPNAFIPTGNIETITRKSQKSIVSVGRFVYEKRYEVLIEAFKKVHDKHPDYSLILYGDGPYRDKYNHLIETYGLSGCVQMPGYTHNSMKSISTAGIFVLPSLYEGIPNSLIEALAVGVPTVSTDCTPGGPDFLTDHGRRGLLVPVDSVDSMADSICKIIESQKLADELSGLGQEIITHLDKHRIAILWKEFFCSVCD